MHLERCTVEVFPPEIWRYVFSFTCVDGGYTGCSLSLTSKYFQALSSDIKWYSISLKGPEQMSKFISTMERIPNHSIVRHLSISWNPELQDLPPDLPITAFEGTDIIEVLCSYRLSKWEETVLRDKVIDDHELESEFIKRMGNRKHQTRMACERLLPLVANDLYSLSASLSMGMHIPRPFWSIPFPTLQELTIFGCSMVRFRVVQPSDDVLFPSLQFLHLIHCVNDTHLFTKCAPNLTHIRLSSVNTLSRFSGSILSIASGTPQIEHDLMSLPWSLRRICLQGQGASPKHSFGRDIVREFGTFLFADMKDVIRILGPLPRPSRRERDAAGPTQYEPLDVEKDWMARMEGKAGCWLEDGENVFSIRHSKRGQLIEIFGNRFGPT